MSDELKKLGNESFKKGSLEEAVNYFSQAIELSPNDYVLYSNRAAALTQQNKFEEARADGQKCVELCPSFAKGYSRKGLAELKLGLIQDATKTFMAGLEVDPNNESLKNGMEDCKKSQRSMLNQQLKSRIASLIINNETFRTYATEDPTYGDRLAACLDRILENPMELHTAVSSNPDPRIKEGLRALLGFDPDDMSTPEPQPSPKFDTPEPKRANDTRTEEQRKADALKDEGNAFYKQKKFKEALEKYDDALKVTPNEASYMSNKAAVFMEMGELDKALSVCQEALEFSGVPSEKKAKLHNRIATIQRKKGEYELALESYDRSLLEHQDRHVRAAKKETQREMEKKKEESFINPEMSEAARQKGNEFFKNRQYPEAKEAYDEAIKRNPKDPKNYTNRAAALTNLLEFPSALMDCEKALELDPSFVRALTRKGTLHLKLKENHKALSAFQAALKLDEKNTEAINGLQQTMMAIQTSQSSDSIDEDQVNHAMADPEIRHILSDPQFRNLLQQAATNPNVLQEAMKDPTVASGVQKLVAAGILKVQ